MRMDKNSKHGVARSGMGGSQHVNMRTHVSKVQPEPETVAEYGEPQVREGQRRAYDPETERIERVAMASRRHNTMAWKTRHHARRIIDSN